MLILLSLTSVCSSQENSLNDIDIRGTVYSDFDIDTIGMALIKGLEYRELYTNEVLLTKVLKYEISLWQEKSTNKDLEIRRLATELSKQPAYITTHSWATTCTITALSVILTVILTLQLME